MSTEYSALQTSVHVETQLQREPNISPNDSLVSVSVGESLEGSLGMKATGCQTHDDIEALYEERTDRMEPVDQAKHNFSKLKLSMCKGDSATKNCPSEKQALTYKTGENPTRFYTSEDLGATPVLEKGQDILEEMKRMLAQTFNRQVTRAVHVVKPEPKATFVPGKTKHYMRRTVTYKKINIWGPLM